MFSGGDRGGGGVSVGGPPTTPASYTSASARVAARRRSAAGGAFNTSRHSPFNTPGRSTPLNRSVQLVEGSGQYSVEGYGSSLPALVMEALAFADRNVEMSAVLSPSGWAWLVCSRRLLVWRYKQEESRRVVNHQFRELTLPSSDLAHRAQLVVVYSANEGQVPSCVAASPEGSVRYWATIAHEGSYCEVSTELQGQECDSLVFLGPELGCLLATTTSTILLLQPGAGGRNIDVRQLKVPAGLLGGISRRVSSLVFGSMPTQAPEARLVRAVGVMGKEANERAVLVLSANSLQKWYLSPSHADTLIYECNVEKFIREGFVDHVWGRERAGATQLRVWLVDLQPLSGAESVMVLTAAVNPQVSQQLVYALATMETGGSSPPTSVSNFSVLKHSEYYQDSAENVLLAQRFLLSSSTAYIYNKKTVLCVSAVGEGDSGDRVEFSGAGDSILGVGRSQGLPLIFSANNGIVSITSTSPHHHLSQSGLLNESIAEDGVSKLGESLNLNYTGELGQDRVTRLQAAFLQYSKNFPQAQMMLDDLFPGSDNTQLDTTVLQLSTKLLDDSPATDPRWAESSKAGGIGAPTSLIVSDQLKDKSVAHHLYINFLQKTGLWPRLSNGTIKDNRVLTRTTLGEHSQRLTLATVLRSKHKEHQHLVDSAIRFVVSDRGETPKGKLTHSDLFYCKVSQIQDIVYGILRAQEEVLSADVAPRDAVSTIFSVNSLLLSILSAARSTLPLAPATSAAALGPSATLESGVEHVPWTATIGPKGLRTLLIQQHGTTVQIGLVRAEDGATRAKLYGQLVEVTDLILSDYQPQLSTTSEAQHSTLTHTYHTHRYNLIQPLVSGCQYDPAVSLAEKFCDFRTLVEVCDKTDNQERLAQYMARFGSEGFSDFVFRWYMETGKRGRLLSQTGTATGELTRFLQDYPSLSWLNQIQTRDFNGASNTLRQLAQEETTYLGRKKTMLSISKLCGLVSGGSSGMRDMDLETNNDSVMIGTAVTEEDEALKLEEELILHQEQLPDTVLSAHSLDPNTMRVLSPVELIHMYTGKENLYANEFDFKKSLDLLAFVPEEEIGELRRLIWVRAILRNTWEHLDTDSPLQAISETLLFKTLELAFLQGSELQDLMVPIDELMSSEELAGVAEDANFKFLMQAGFEHITKLMG